MIYGYILFLGMLYSYIKYTSKYYTFILGDFIRFFSKIGHLNWFWKIEWSLAKIKGATMYQIGQQKKFFFNFFHDLPK